MTYRHTLYASYLGYVTQAICNNLPPLLFVTFNERFGVSLGQLGLLVSINFAIQMLVDLLSAQTGGPNRQSCWVGDRLYTDIAVAKNAGAVSVLVLSGETTPEMLAAPETKPDYVFPSVRELSQALG